jgi:hypothetical protein
VSRTKGTAFCTALYYNNGNNRILINDDSVSGNTNDYDLGNLKKAIKRGLITRDDYIFLAGHFLTRCGIEHSRRLMEIVRSTGAGIIFDAVPHNLYTRVSLEEFNSVINDYVEILIAEYRTLMALLGKNPSRGNRDEDDPTDTDIEMIMKNFTAKIINIRYGKANISKQITCARIRGENGKDFQILERGGTGFDECPPEKHTGFGDKLTAKFLKKYLAST